jgi:hypothetical protein
MRKKIILGFILFFLLFIGYDVVSFYKKKNFFVNMQEYVPFIWGDIDDYFMTYYKFPENEELDSIVKQYKCQYLKDIGMLKVDSGAFYFVYLSKLFRYKSLRKFKYQQEIKNYTIFDYFKDNFIYQNSPVVLLAFIYNIPPCYFNPGFFYYGHRPKSEFDTKNIESLIDDLNDTFVKNYFKNNNIDSLSPKTYIKNFIKMERHDDKLFFDIECTLLLDTNKETVDYHSVENDIFLDSLIKYYNQNSDLFFITGLKKVIFPIRYPIKNN